MAEQHKEQHKERARRSTVGGAKSTGAYVATSRGAFASPQPPLGDISSPPRDFHPEQTAEQLFVLIERAKHLVVILTNAATELVGRGIEIAGRLDPTVKSPYLAWDTPEERLRLESLAQAMKSPVVPLVRESQVASGLKGAIKRGDATKARWVKDGILIPAQQLADSWGITPAALRASIKRDELFAMKVNNRHYYPSAFTSIDRESVALICQALGSLSPEEKFVFWTRQHGSISGRSVPQSLAAGVQVDQMARLANAWAQERGAARAGSPA